MTAKHARRVPVRIQRKRTKGWRMPAGAVYVGRPSRWGNPFCIQDYNFENADGSPAPYDEDAARTMAFRDFEHWIGLAHGAVLVTPADARQHLRGKDRACWCRLDQLCHADVLLDLANRGDL